MTEQIPTAKSWDTFWHGADHGSAFSAAGTSHPLVLSFWDQFFRTVGENYDDPKIVDVASGSGAVVERAMMALSDGRAEFTCVDISDSAIKTLTDRFPGVQGLVADARSIPLNTGAFDIATSQFGIEYAGIDAIDEVVRLIAHRGQLALLLHHRGGGIFRQCSASLDAIEKMEAARFMPLSIEMFHAGFAAHRGGDKKKYEDASKRFVPAIQSMESIMKQYGTHVADGTIVQLYKDVRTMHGRMANYDPAEVIGWLEKMHSEVIAFRGRMASMCGSAIDASTFEQLRDKLREQGFQISLAEALELPDREVPLAWSLVAVKA